MLKKLWNYLFGEEPKKAHAPPMRKRHKRYSKREINQIAEMWNAGKSVDLIDKAAYRYTKAERCWSSGYSYYNRWREQLAELAGYPVSSYEYVGKEWPSHAATVWNDPKPGPFMELINFSDCEGVIGPAVCAKLAKDFAEFQAKADAHPEDGFRRGYAEWRKGFDLAADGGCVVFH